MKNKKRLKKGVQTVVKLLISEKSWNFKKEFRRSKKSSTSEKCFRSAKSANMKKEQIKLKTNIEKLKRNLRTIMESIKKSLKRPKKCKFGKIGKTKNTYEKKKTMFEKGQQRFEKRLLKCVEDHKTEIKKCLKFTEDRKSSYRKILKSSVKRLKTVIGKTKWAPQDRQRILTKRERKQYSDEKKFRRVKRA